MKELKNPNFFDSFEIVDIEEKLEFCQIVCSNNGVCGGSTVNGVCSCNVGCGCQAICGGSGDTHCFPGGE